MSGGRGGANVNDKEAALMATSQSKSCRLVCIRGRLRIGICVGHLVE